MACHYDMVTQKRDHATPPLTSYPRADNSVYKTVDLRPNGPKLMRSIEGKEAVIMVDKKLLDVLACPACRAKVVPEGERLVCQNAACGLSFPVRDDIPIMLIQEAQRPEKREQ
jgi:uncharacterized protein YbaR (Trm112 family)